MYNTRKTLASGATADEIHHAILLSLTVYLCWDHLPAASTIE